MGKVESEITTGSVVGRYVGPDGEEITVAVRLPNAMWDELTGYLEAMELVERQDAVHEDSYRELRIPMYLELEIQEWMSRTSLWSADGDLDDDVPF